ncbi:MAG TPA: methyltransferase domain-containing protein, partial [Polyangiaceae bacterium]|nr:methyltransferase domain-containing protein [Polyangiaceae bacterium]
MTEPNPEFPADQSWQDRGGASWVRQQERIDVQLDPFGRAVLGKLGPQAGERALDVGCGSGQTVLELAELVGPSGRVVGVDISEQMLARARERVRAQGYGAVELVLGDAQTHALPPDQDLEFSRFGVMFFQDSVAAFRNLFAALRAGGRLGFVCWQAMTKNEWAQVLLQAVLPILPKPALPPMLQPDRPGPFYFDSPERISSILSAAGFGSIEIEPFERP